MRHVGRGAHHVLRWVGSFAAVVILIALFGIWRLMQGPIELNWLTPYVEAAIARSDIGLKAAISGVRFGIDRETHQLDLRAENVRLWLPDGQRLARLPEIAASFGLGALLRGRLLPTQVVVERPVVHLVREADGAISAQIGGDSRSAPDLGPQMLEQLGGPPQRDAPLGLLRLLSVRGATVTVDDRQSGRTWQANRVDIAVDRSRKGARGDVSFAVPLGASMPELHAAYRYFADRQVLDLDLSFDGVEPAAIPPLIPELAQLSHVEAPVSGTLRTRIDLKQGRAQGSLLDLALGSGRLHSEWLPTGVVGVDKGELHAIYAPENNEVRVERLALDLGAGTRLVLNGTLAGVTPELIAAPADARPAGRLTGAFTAALTHVPVARLAELWPEAFSPGGRQWTLENIRDGMLDKASVRLVLDLDPAAHTADVLSADGQLRYRNLTIDYFNGLPPVRKVDGTAAFAGHHLDFTPTGGMLEGLAVTGGSLRLTDLGSPTEWLTIDLSLAGPLRDALDVIDSKPLRYAHAAGLDPAHVGGRAEMQLHFKLPLLADLNLDAVEYRAKATIAGASIADVALARGISDGNFTLDIVPSGARLRGTGRFDDIPAALDASLPFHPRNGVRATYRVTTTLDEAAQHRLGLDLAPDRLNGPVGVEATYTALAGKRAEATARLDLRGASAALPEAGWKKLPGQPGTARIALDLDDGRLAAIPQIDVTAPGLDGRLAALFSGAGGQLERVDIRRLAVGASDLAGTLTRRAGGGWRAEIRSPRLDVHDLLKEATTAAPATPSPPLALDARIGRLVLGKERELHDVTAQLLRVGGIWQSGRVAGRYADGHQMSLRLGGEDGNRVTFQSDDLGASLKLLDIADNVVGGQVSVAGQFTQTAGKRVLRAHIDGSNYMVVRAPGLARILALPSLTGFASLLSGSGLPFMTLRGDIAYSDGRIAVERLLAFGESLGITANGWYDIDRDRLELRGTVAPAYAINSILGNLPVIGPLLGGGSQGLFAANYRLSGSGDDPQVSVNPLSALAPGFLRQLFAPLVGFPAAAAEPQATPSGSPAPAAAPDPETPQTGSSGF